MWAGAPDHAANAKETVMSLPRIATRKAWLAARKELLAKEKDLTRLRDELNAERRDLPVAEIEKDYIFDGSHGAVRLIDIFEGRRQLIIYYFMSGPGWEDGCPSCTAGTDELPAGLFAHLPPATPATPWCRGRHWPGSSGGRPRRAGTCPGTPRPGPASITTSGSRSVSRPGPASTTSAPRPSPRPWGRTSSPQTSPSRCPAGAASSKPAGGCSTPTPSTPAAWSPPAAPTTSSTSPRSAGKRNGRNPRDAASPQGPPRPTSHRNRPPGTSSADVRNAHLASWTSN